MSKNNDKENRKNLIEIRDILKGEMDKFNSINSEMIDNQSDFDKIGKNYNKYSEEIDKSRSHITQLKKREFYENLFVYIGFYFFFGCVAIVWLKRFPIHKIIVFIVRLLTNLAKQISSVITNINNHNNPHKPLNFGNNYNLSKPKNSDF